MPYMSTKYLWPEKDLEKLKKVNEKDEEKISFNEEEFKTLVNPIIEKLIEKNNSLLYSKDEINKIISNNISQQISLLDPSRNSLPIWVPITVSVLSTSLFFAFIIILNLLFK